MTQAYNLSRVINRSLTGYDRKVRPNAGGPPVIVKIEFKVISFGEIKEANMVRPLNNTSRYSVLFYRKSLNLIGSLIVFYLTI